MLRILFIFSLLFLSACATQTVTTTSGGTQPAHESQAFKLSNLAKSDVSYMADTAMKQMEDLMQEMMIKLYRRNPIELSKGAEKDINVRVASIFSHRDRLIFAELQNREEIRAMLLGLDPDFEGDRVFAIMAGFAGMIRRSYGYKKEFFMLTPLNGQALYNAARNIEVLDWRLRSRLNAQGGPILLTNSLPGEEENLSFERQFGKMIALQDFMAEITASRSNRAITKVVQSVGSMVFLPVPY